MTLATSSLDLTYSMLEVTLLAKTYKTTFYKVGTF